MKKALLIFLLLVLTFTVWWSLHRGRSRSESLQVEPPRQYVFHCRTCDDQWSTDLDGAVTAFSGGIPQWGKPAICHLCSQKGSFLMEQCPFCHEYYTSRRPAQDGTLLCPHCGKNVLAWRRKP